MDDDGDGRGDPLFIFKWDSFSRCRVEMETCRTGPEFSFHDPQIVLGRGERESSSLTGKEPSLPISSSAH